MCAAGTVGAGLAAGVGADAGSNDWTVGTSSCLLHRGQRPRLPAAASFTRIVEVQYGQLNSIAIVRLHESSVASVFRIRVRTTVC